mmetsp:Transcript_2741/g.7669  ORF Transcript_2741/g.7669 Transcript_2741/m.7669 type:complete len:423 (+) Transcript_2741:138-1406(+)|eukprot:CAMPEP_0168777074 /NCGR_PEP_ID=MMETSP0725-20121227/6368_1 /TAXON_ID=265536 /ORGANISM="Amphiprora sp., Strain CCMP467" /LENGTH=422 /DNA_ID=CAMNT_0008826779 /DNA_START=40 /DNA_END=1308 /DNA_ORIENTATION=-
MSPSSSSSSSLWMEAMAALYVLSGVCQPLLMTLCKNFGLADPTAQLYMVFYYLGPSLLFWYSLYNHHQQPWIAPWRTRYTAMLIAAFDVVAQVLNYSGNSLAGPTLFAIIYSSVTVWTAVWARIFLKRQLTRYQWLAIALVFCGLTLTATDTYQHHHTNHEVSLMVGDGEEEVSSSSSTLLSHTEEELAHFQQVVRGTLLTVVGSALHAGSYVWSEAVLTGPDSLSVAQNTGLQCLTATSLLIVWQMVYTLPRWDVLITKPLVEAHTPLVAAVCLLVTFGLVNLIHASAFFGTIKFYKGGSVMAGVFKGLQAVLVFGATHVIYCGRTGGQEMCFSRGKWWSLVTVVSGVVLFSAVTPQKKQQQLADLNDSIGEPIPTPGRSTKSDESTVASSQSSDEQSPLLLISKTPDKESQEPYRQQYTV